MLSALGRWLPDWLFESRQLSGLSADERGMLVAKQQQANQSLAPYIGLAILILSPFSLLVDIERAGSGLFDLGLTGRCYVIAAVCHGILALSAVPALAMKHQRVAANHPLAQRLLRLHLISLLPGLLVLSLIAMLASGVFMRLACLLVVTNFLYAVHWRLRAVVNATSLASGTALIFTLAPLTAVSRLVTFVDLLTLVILCVIGGAIVHRERIAGYLAQYRESRHLARLREEISVASQLQQSLLPTPWPATPAFSVQGMMRPAQDIGGDFYDHFHVHNDAVCLVVADVCGKGIPAGLFGMSAKSVLHTTALQPANSAASHDPGALVSHANDLLHEGNTEFLFVTAVFAHYHPATGALSFVNAGHVQPLLIPRIGEPRWLDAPKGRALGARGQQRYAAAHLELQAGDTVLLITDGITEAMDADFREFGLARVKDTFEGVPCEGPQACVERLLAAVDAFTGGIAQSDDITCMALCHRPGDASPLSAGDGAWYLMG